ncbi:MAG: rhodanese-like domain-containing protein [Acidimicrobiales bacterium]|nr:rhodanese-like domain-containing protein [Acidimicrobiales bacterium]
MTLMTGSITAGELRDRLIGGGELALLDAREQGVYHRSHLFHAACVPLSHLELLLNDLVPRRSTPIVWCDEDGAVDGLAARAASRATELGWTDNAVLAGGATSWAADGGELYSGVNVPSKAFGEYVEHAFDTPRLPAAEVKALLDAAARGEADIVVLDSRPLGEFRRMSIPTGTDCPGAELVHRVKEMAPDPETLVIVNCAGRTRSIIGAQSLINARLENRVVALENGTMGWELAGFDVARGEDVHAPDPRPDARAWAEAAAADVGARFGVDTCTPSEVDIWAADTGRTTYLLDVRTPEEFEDGHVDESRNAPGGQLVQATDEYVATRGARLVLIDDNGVRATMTASWLRQLGWHDTMVLAGGVHGIAATGVTLRTGPRARTPVDRVPTLKVSELAARLGDEPDSTVVIDLGTSIKYRKRGHIPGAWWGVRSRLDEARAAIGEATTIVLTSTDGQLAKLAVRDAQAQWPAADVFALAGGNKGWRHAGNNMEPGFERATTTPDDVWYKPYDHDEPGDVVQQHMHDYLTWEVALVEQIGRDPTVDFPHFD